LVPSPQQSCASRAASEPSLADKRDRSRHPEGWSALLPQGDVRRRGGQREGAV